MMRFLPFAMIVLGGCCCSNGTATDPPSAATRSLREDLVIKFTSPVAIKPSNPDREGWDIFEPTLTYTNVSNRPVWIYGFPNADPVCLKETRPAASGTNDWEAKRTFTCGVAPPKLVKVKPGASHAFPVNLLSHPGGVESRVSVFYRTDPMGPVDFIATSEIRRFGTAE